MNSYYPPLPPLVGPLGWPGIRIDECNEPLVSLRDLRDDRIRVRPEYFSQGISGALDDCYVREGVAMRLVEATKNLPRGIGLLVLDGWRPVSVQQALFDKYLALLASTNPEWSPSKLETEAQRYVSFPSDRLDRPSPHLTGGSVDLTLIDENGDEVQMGSPFDAFTDLSRTRYFEERLAIAGSINNQEQEFLENRRTLFAVLHSTGLRNYAEEWWHFDYGNQFWAAVTGSMAVYGRANLDAAR